MKLIYKFTIYLFFFMCLSGLSAQTEEQYSNYLKTGTDSEKAIALEYFGKEKKDKSKASSVIEILNSSKNPKVTSRAAIALGYFAETGNAVEALKLKIESETDPIVVYPCLVALFNIQTKSEKPDEKIIEAFRFADQNRRTDELVSSFLDKVKNRIKF